MKYPHRIKDGPQEVVIYRSQERGRVRFKIAYSVDGSRKLVSRDDETEAHRDARRALTMLLNRPTVFAQSEDAGIFRAAQSALLPFAGVGVDEACRDYARARKALNGAPLMDAVAAFQRHKPVKDDRNVAQLVASYVEELDEHASRAYFNSLRRRLRRFARSFGERSVNTISQDELEKWMRGLNVGKRTHNNERQVLVTFFNWCQTKRYLPRGVEHEAAQLKVMHAPARVTIYTIDETARLMEQLTARTELVPYAAIGFFAGVRPAELARLRFEEALRWKHGDIEIRADQSKTGFRRLVPMTANLQAWLKPFATRHGLIAPRQADDKLAAFAKHMGLPWPRDVMRHSYISYTVARTEQIGGVALWAGNSEGVVKTNYLEMVTKAEGEAYGGILPKWPENVVPLAA